MSQTDAWRSFIQRWWTIVWWFVAPWSVLLALMDVYAQTAGRYVAGELPPPFGIYIGHGDIEKILELLLVLVLSAGWLGFCALLTLYSLARRRHVSRRLIWQALVLFIAVGIPFLPSPFWDEMLLATIGPGNSGGRLLANAAGSGDVARLRKLLDSGIEVDAPNLARTKESFALGEAVRRRRREAVELLLQRGANPNHRVLMEKPLVSAVLAGDAAMVRLLVEHGADPCVSRVLYNGNTRSVISVQALANDQVRAVLPACPVPLGNAN